MPNAINVQHYHKVRAGNDLRIENGIPLDAVVIGQIGRLARVKNHEFTIHLLKDLLARDPNYFLVIVGEGVEGPKLVELAKELGVRDRVLFAGLQDDVADWLATFDVTLMPSHREGLGNVVLESQAMGVPVIASNGVPVEVDVGLSLIQFLPLDLSGSGWLDAVEASLKLPKPDERSIYQAFEEQGYVLESSLEKLQELYTDKG